jgi:hypothetical protein
MPVSQLGPLWLTLIASLVIAFVLLAIRIVVMQRVQQRRQRESRQETERLKSVIAWVRRGGPRTFRTSCNAYMLAATHDVPMLAAQSPSGV